MNDSDLEFMCLQYDIFYWRAYRLMRQEPNKVMAIIDTMSKLWDQMELSIPQSHYDEINAVVYNIHRR